MRGAMMERTHAKLAAARRLVRHVTVLSASPGALLCNAGGPADEALLIVSGIVESSETGEVHTRQLVAGSGTPPVFPQALRARSEVKFARLPVAAFEAEVPDLQIDGIAPAILELLHRRDLVAGASALFGSLDADAIADLERESDWVELKRGNVLVRQGDEGDRAFVLLAGRLQAMREVEDGPPLVVGDIAVGETVGEMSFFTGKPRSTTVRAVRDSLLIGLARPSVERLLAARPEAVRHVIKVQVERVQRANQGARLRAPLTNIAIVPLDDRVAAGEFCRQLSSELWAFGQVVHLDAAQLDARLHRPGLAGSPEDGPDAPRLMMWLDELERAARFVVYETSARHPGWVARSISRADAVILLARGAGDPAVTDIEHLVSREEGEYGAAQRMLVLLHEDDVLPSRTAAWLAPRTIARHLHVRLSRPDEVGRVARFIAGRAVGLVLGAGGARGFAHVGVLRALQEARIPIDMIGGTSMGAAMSAQHAMGWSPDRIVETGDEVWNHMRPHAEYTWPLMSLVRGKRAQHCGHMMYGNICIEDLWLPFFCVSSDLTDASMFVHRSGSLLEAVTASSSLPAVIVPTRVGNHLLCDGSLFNTLPVGLAREYGCGTLIASRVSVPQDKDFFFDQIPTLGQVLRHKVTRRPIRYPGIMSVLLRSSMIAAVGRENQESLNADLLFVPPLEQYGLMEFAALAKIVDGGYASAKSQLEEWGRAGRLAVLPRGSVPVNDRMTQWLASRVESSLASRLPSDVSAVGLRLADSDMRAIGHGSLVATIVVNSRRGLTALASMDATRIAEAYREGALDVEGSLQRVLALRDAFTDRHPFTNTWRFLRPRLFGQVSSDKKWIADHYERDAGFYLAFLDRRHRCYSQALFESPDEALEDAQTRKLDAAADALGLRPGARVLDVGGGWGAFTEHGGRRGLHVTSLTISKASEQFIQGIIDSQALPCRVLSEHLMEHESAEPYDGIVNLGVTEHLPDYVATLKKYRAPAETGRVRLPRRECRPRQARLLGIPAAPPVPR